MLPYHGGEIFRLAINSSKSANRIFSYMVVCRFGGPKFYILYRLLEKQASVFEDSVVALIYIAGYLTAKRKRKIQITVTSTMKSKAALRQILN